MRIDWLTFGAQIVNFLILVALLRWVLYDRILGVIDRRTEEVRSRFEEAKEKREQAEGEARSLEEQRQELDDRREGLMREAREEADERRRELMDEARSEVEGQRQRWRRAVERERTEFLDTLRTRAADATCDAVRRALEELADAELQDVVLRRFAARLEDAELDELEADEAHVATAFEPTDAQKDRIREAVRDRWEAIDFETDPELVCGVELRAGGRRIAWSVRDYIEQLEARVDDLLEERALKKGGAAEDDEDADPDGGDGRDGDSNGADGKADGDG